MFEQLPETVPSKNKRKFEAFGAAFAVQVALVAGFIVLQMAMPEKLGEFQLLTTLYMAAPPPPPPAAPASAAPEAVRRARPKPATVTPTAAVVSQPRPAEKEPEVIAPTTIPKDIARIVEASSPSAGATTGGVPGGIRGGLPGGVSGGILGGILGGAGAAVPPPPPPPAPIRVGGNVKPPKIVHIEQPHYPPAAKKAGIEGVVIVEATVTADGTVDKVKVISGPPLLTDAAAEAVSRWKYEPTYLNGEAVPVVLTARINFSLSNPEK
jgi:periplasmic protein TonB